MENLCGRSGICLKNLCAVLCFLMVLVDGGKMVFFVLVLLLECVQASLLPALHLRVSGRKKHFFHVYVYTVSDELQRLSFYESSYLKCFRNFRNLLLQQS